MTDNVDGQQSNASETEARVFGWVPKGDFKGNQDEWRDADTFLARGKEINGFLRKDLDKLKAQILQRDNELAEIRGTVQEFSAYHQQTEQRSYERALEALKADKKIAIAAGDGDLTVAIEDQIDELKDKRPTVKPVVKQEDRAPVPSQDFAEWVAVNEWYRDDKLLQATANGFADVVAAENPGLSGKPFLNKVKDLVKENFPEKFNVGSRERPNAVEGSNSNSPGGKGKKGFADLPADAQAACLKFEKQKLLTRDQYIADYFS